MAALFISSYEDPDVWRRAFLVHKPDMDFRVWDRGLADGGLAATDDIDIILAALPPAGVITRARFPNLKAIFSLWAGVDRLLLDETLPADVPLYRLIDDVLTAGMNEYVAAWVLYFHRHFDVLAAQQRDRLWREVPAPDTSARRIGIMGMGALGRAAAETLTGLGFQSIAGYSRTKKTVPGVESFHGEAGLAPFLAQTEILVCLLPLTPATHGILNADAFAEMPEGAVIINPGRGRHLVTDDLIAALDAGRLRGAVLDVFLSEPLATDSVLWSHPKVIVTPHIASMTVADSAARSVSANIDLFLAGKTAPGLVDRTRGY